MLTQVTVNAMLLSPGSQFLSSASHLNPHELHQDQNLHLLMPGGRKLEYLDASTTQSLPATEPSLNACHG